VRELVLRDLKLHYRRSVLGVAWSQLSPLLQLGIMVFVFTHIVPLKIPNYPVFVFSGLLVWTWFSSSIVFATESVVNGADLVRRPGIALPLIPLIPVATGLANFLLSLPLLLLAITFLADGLHITIVLLPVLVAIQALLTLGPALVLSAMHVTFRDVVHIVNLLLIPLFYATPIFYDVGRVPPQYQWVYRYNPLARLVGAYRQVLLYGQWPSLGVLVGLAVLGAVLASAGLHVYERRADRFSEEL